MGGVAVRIVANCDCDTGGAMTGAGTITGAETAATGAAFGTSKGGGFDGPGFTTPTAFGEIGETGDTAAARGDILLPTLGTVEATDCDEIRRGESRSEAEVGDDRLLSRSESNAELGLGDCNIHIRCNRTRTVSQCVEDNTYPRDRCFIWHGRSSTRRPNLDLCHASHWSSTMFQCRSYCTGRRSGLR